MTPKDLAERSPSDTKDVAVYLDFENLYVSLKTTAKMDPNFDLLMEKCREFGRVILARAYADWSEFARMFTSQMFANGFEPVYVPTRKIYDSRSRSEARKNSVDIHITIDIIKSLFLHQNVDTIILISGDRDYVPLINQIRQSGKDVYAIGVAGCTSSELSIAVDEMFYYHQLLDTEDKTERTVDIYNQLLKALRIANRRGYPATLGIVKPIMKELVEGFNERDYKNPRGLPFQKFKDLVQEAERRRLVKLVTNGATSEIFLWAEAPSPGQVRPPQRREDGRREDGRREDGRREDGRREDGRREDGRREDGRREDGRSEEPTRRGRGRRRGFERRDADDASGQDSSTDESATSEAQDRESAGTLPDEGPSATEARPITSDAVERDGQAAPAGTAQAQTPVRTEVARGDHDDQLTGLQVDSETWAVMLEAIESFGDKPPTPRKLMNQLKKARTAKAFGEARPTDADLDDLIRQCVDSGRLKRERKGFSTILRLVGPVIESAGADVQTQ